MVLCQAITIMVAPACTKPRHFDPAPSWGVLGKIRKHAPNMHTERCPTSVPHPWQCHHVSCTYQRMSLHTAHTLGCAITHVLQLEGVTIHDTRVCHRTAC